MRIPCTREFFPPGAGLCRIFLSAAGSSPSPAAPGPARARRCRVLRRRLRAAAANSGGSTTHTCRLELLYYAALAQSGDVAVAIAEFAQDLLAVLARFGAGGAQPARGAAQRD